MMPKEIPNLNAINQLGPAFLGLQASQLLDIVDFQGNELIASLGLSMPSRAGSTVMYLKKNQAATVTELSRFLGLSHQLVSHRLKDLKARDLIAEKRDPDDRRKTLIVLTRSGKALARQIESLCREIEGVYLELFEEIGVDLFSALVKAKQALAERSLGNRVSDRRRRTGSK